MLVLWRKKITLRDVLGKINTKNKIYIEKLLSVKMFLNLTSQIWSMNMGVVALTKNCFAQYTST